MDFTGFFIFAVKNTVVRLRVKKTPDFLVSFYENGRRFFPFGKRVLRGYKSDTKLEIFYYLLKAGGVLKLS